MAAEKKPSIYADRGTIGSSDELDEYGVWVKSEPQDLSSPGSGSIIESETAEGESADIPDLEIPGVEDLPDFSISGNEAEISALDSPEPEAWEDEEIPPYDENEVLEEEELLPLEDDETVVEEIPSLDSLESESFESEPFESDLVEEIGEDVFGEESKDEEIEELGFTEIAMDDLTGTIELEGPAEFDEGPLPELESSPSSSEAELSTQLLLRIAEELSSIRAELTNLKKDLAGLKADDTSEEPERGFFDEEEDEKIALTGDELDNILNTADFTEEAGTDATGTDTIAIDTLAIDTTGDDEDLGISDVDLSIDEETETSQNEFLNSLLDDSSDTDETEMALLEEVSDDEEPDIIPLEDLAGDLDMDLADEPEGDEEDFVKTESFLDDSDIFPGSSETETVEELEELPDFISEAGDELLQISEEGAQPITPAPDPEDSNFLHEDPMALNEFGEVTSSEDTSLEEISLEETSGEEIFLEENPLDELSIENSSLDEISMDETSLDETSLEDISLEETALDESLDFSDAVIDQPDLSSGIVDNPIEEPSLESISIDLEMEEEPKEQTNELDTLDEFGDDTIDLDLLDISEEIPEEMPGESNPDEDLSDDELEIPLAEEDTEAPFSSGTETIADDDELALIPEGFVVESDEIQPGYEEIEEEESLQEEEFLSPDEKLDSSAVDELEAIDLDETALEEIIGDETAAPVSEGIPSPLKQELKTVLSYMDKLLESLPDDKIEEFAQSEYFETYKKLFKELGLV